MDHNNSYQDQQIEEMFDFYQEVARRSPRNLSVKDAVIAWLTEGRAEQFRENYLKQEAM